MSTTLVSQVQNENNPGKVLTNAYFLDQRRLVRHQIDGYDNFIENKLYEILDEYNSNPKNIIYADYDKELGKNKLEYRIIFGKIYISKPIVQDDQSIQRQMFPNDARLQKLTYSLTIKVDISHRITEHLENGQVKESECEFLSAHPIGKIPLMLQSKFCVLNENNNKTLAEMGEDKYDYGGYFIVNGAEKVVVSQERQAENMVYCFQQGKGQSKFSHKCEIRSASETNPFNVKNAEVKLTAKEGTIGRTIKVKVQGMRQELPLFVIFRALGIISDKQIVEFILYSLSDSEVAPYLELIRPSIDEAAPIRDQQTALEYCSKYVILQTGIKPVTFQTSAYKLWQTHSIIMEEFLPHLGNSPIKKAYFLGYMTYRLIYSYLNDDYADRDSFLNKRVDSTGENMAFLFRANFKKMMRDVENKCRIELTRHRFQDLNTSLNKKIKKSDIESGMKYGLSTGNWGLQSKDNKKGIARMLNRLSYLSFLSDLRKVQAPMNKTLKSQQPRLLHSTQWGRICPAETPEGAPIGIAKHLSMMTVITVGSSSEPVRNFLQNLGIENLEDVAAPTIYGKCKVFVNGDWVGIHDRPKVLYEELIKLRRQGMINIYTSISWNVEINEIYVSTDGGRLVRPLVVVKDNNILLTEEIVAKLNVQELTWDELLTETNGVFCIEYLDVSEENNAMIAMSPIDLEGNKKTNDRFYEYTHCEISPNLIFGVCATTAPLSEHQQAPRVLYYSAQCKQAVGIFATNFEDRFDTSGNALYYPQRPLIQPYNTSFINVDKLPNGQNVVVAIACYMGYNQEDSVIVNKSSLERGMFTTSYFRTYEGKEQKNQSTLEEEKFCKPVKYNPNGTARTAGMKEGSSYGKLEESGFVKEGTRVSGGDAIIGKCIPLKTTSDDDIKFRDASTFVKSTDSGVVDKVYVNKDGEGFKFGRVRVRSERIPEIGDKFASRFGNKGTCGITFTQEDMPFTKHGIVPDLIINPIGFPKRMTIGQLIETVCGKTGSLKGYSIDGSPFTKMNPNDISDILESCGFQRNGLEVLYNGKTGEQIDAAIFIGPSYYHRLKHMVQDKLHCTKGDHDVLTLKGWKPIPEITLSDEVASLVDNKLVYQKPINVFHYSNYKGKMYRIKNQLVDLDVTSNHRMYVSRPYGRKHIWQPYDFIRADDLFGKQVKYKRDADWDVPNYQFVLPAMTDGNNILRPDLHVDMDAWLTFFGIWIAEGWSVDNKKVTIAANKPRVQRAFDDVIPKLGFHLNKTKAMKWTISNVQLVSYMQQFSVGAPNKFLPDWVFKLSQRQSRILIESMILGDGYIDKRNICQWYSTTSIKLADQFMQLCLHAGWSSNKTVHVKAGTENIIYGRKVINNYDILRLSVIKTKNQPEVNHGHHKKQNIQEEEMYDYEGSVYCVEVPGNVFMVRRNGKPVWTGNSRSSGPYSQLVRQPSVGRARDGGFRIGEMERDAMLSHGTVQFLKERMFDVSDKYFVTLCKETGMIAAVNPEKGIYRSLYSNNNTDFVRVQLPYASKLLVQELLCMGVVIKMKTDSPSETKKKSKKNKDKENKD